MSAWRPCVFNSAAKVRRHRGFSLLETVVLAGVLGVVVVAGFALLKASQMRQMEANRIEMLASADRAIASFVATNGRLPCPDTSGAGLEDCSGTAQKGWVPTVTLGLTASAPARGVQKLRYVVYRGAGTDLAALVDRFNPSQWSNYSATPSGSFFTYTQLGVLDFCAGLRTASRAAPSAAAAYIKGAGGTLVNVAYGLAEGGMDRDGDGAPFDDTLNNNTGIPGLESPGRAADYAYDDLVMSRSFADLTATLDCPQTTRSIDAMAQALEVVNEVQSQKDWSKTFAIIMTTVDAVKTVVSGIKLANSIAVMGTSTAALSAAASGLATNAALCAAIITAPVGCPLAAIYGTGVGLATAAIVASGVAIAANATALALNATATVETGIIAGRASAAANSSTPNSLADLLAQLLKAYNDAVTQAAKDKAASDAARAAANTALTNYNNTVTSLKTTAHVRDTTGSNDTALDTALNGYVDYTDALHKYYEADGKAKAKRREAAEAATAANAAASAYNVAAAITPATPAGIIAATKATADAARAADLAAAEASKKDPANLNLAKAATDASIAAIAASIDEANAANDPANYVKNKQDFATSQRTSADAFAAEATTLETAAAAQKTRSDTLLTTYNAAVETAVNSSAYNYTRRVCLLGLSFCFDVLDSDKELVRNALTNARNAYDDYISKDAAAKKREAVTAASAKNVTDALNAYDSLRNASIGTPGTGTAITLTPGAAAILQAADSNGGMK